MEVSGHLHGGAPVLKKYQITATFANAGIIGTISASAAAGVTLATTQNASDMVGVSLDTGTYTVTQGTGTNSAEALVTFSIRPDVIIRSRRSGDQTTGTALAAQVNTSVSSGGVTVTTGAEWSSSPTYLDGTVWGLTGNNVGQFRKITTVTSTVGTVLVPFDYSIAANDTFLCIPINPNSSVVVQLTSDFLEVDMSDDIATDAELACIGLDLNGTTDSYAYFVPRDHYLNPLA